MKNNKLSLENTKIPLYIPLNIILKGHNKYFEKELEGTNITPSELPYLMRINVEEGITQRQLAELFYVSEAIVTRSVKSLEKKGYIIRNIDPTNKTKRLLSTSEKGKSICENSIGINNNWETIITKTLNEEEKEILTKLVLKIAAESLDLLNKS